MAGSFRLRFMRMLDRRRARSTSLRILPDEVRRVSSLCMPAFMAAVAASEWGDVADMVREAEGDWFRETPVEGEGEACGLAGRVFRSSSHQCQPTISIEKRQAYLEP
jgi:hypothetical protein